MPPTEPEDSRIRKEYDFSHAQRGVHFQRAQKGTRVVLVSDEQDKARKQAQRNDQKPKR